jgi:hypothetical protein
MSLPESFDGIVREDLLEVIYRGQDTYFSKGFLEFLDTKEIDFLRDTATEAYFRLNNGVVVVMKDSYSLKSYVELKKAIWKSQLSTLILILFQLMLLRMLSSASLFRRFGNDDPERIARAFSLIGYLLHKYKDPSKPFAVILF